MSRASTAYENALLAGHTDDAYLAAFTSDPGTTGSAGEVSGGTYARVAETWSSPASGAISNTAALSLNIPASTTVGYFGHFSAVSAGTYGVGAALTSSVTFSSAGTLSIAIGADSVAVS